MAHWQLGEKQHGRQWYDQAIDYIEKRRWRISLDFTPLDLRRFQAEAEELIGLTQQSP